MALQSWLLTDLNQGVFLPNLELRPVDFNGPHTAGMHLKKHVLRGGHSDGIDVIDINNELLRKTDTNSRYGNPSCLVWRCGTRLALTRAWPRAPAIHQHSRAERHGLAQWF